MKTILKFSKLLLFTFLIVNISSCEKEDYLIFTAINQKEVKFQNEFIAEHEVSNATAEHNRIENIKMFATDSLVCKAFSSITKTLQLVGEKQLKNILFLKKNDEKTNLEILEAKPLLYYYKIHPYKSNLGDMCVVEAYDSKNSNN